MIFPPIAWIGAALAIALGWLWAIAPGVRLGRLGCRLAALGLLADVLLTAEKTPPAPETPATLWFAIDVSRSMRTRDADPSRLEAAKRAAVAILDDAIDRGPVGLVAFAGGASLVAAPCRDRAFLATRIERLAESSADPGGSRLGEAVALAARLSDSEPALVAIFTDAGHSREDRRLPAIPPALRLVFIGMGDDRDASPIPGDARSVSDADGLVRTRLDAEQLQRMANETGGVFVRAGFAGEGVAPLSRLLPAPTTTPGAHAATRPVGTPLRLLLALSLLAIAEVRWRRGRQ